MRAAQRDDVLTSKPLHDQSASGGDIAKYALALLLAVGGLVAFYWFDGQWPTVARVLVLLVGLVLGVVVFMATAKGVETREFLSESRFELRKVVWPTRQETTRGRQADVPGVQVSQCGRLMIPIAWL